MIKRFLMLCAIAGLSLASAASYNVSFVQSTIGKGQVVKDGDYKLNVTDNSIVMINGKKKIEVPAKIENGSTKFKRTEVHYRQNNGGLVVDEIQLGGTTEKVTFDVGIPAGGGE